MADSGKPGTANKESDGKHMGTPMPMPAPVTQAHGSKGNEGKHYCG